MFEGWEQWKGLLEEQVQVMRRRLPSWVEVGDIRQAGAEGLLRALRCGNKATDPARVYVIMSIRGAILDEMRKRLWWGRRGPRETPQYITEAHEPAVPPGPDTDLSDQIRLCLPVLNKRHRLIIDRYYFQEIPMLDIARELGVSQPRASQLKTAALQRLRLELIKTGYHPPRPPASGAPPAAQALYRNPPRSGSEPAPTGSTP